MDLGHDPEGKILGILGMGGIGGALARRAAPFDMKIQYHNRHPVAPEQNPTNAKYVSFEQLLRTSDVISVHLPLSKATRHLIGRKEFAMMKSGVVIINTARGKIVDEEALVDALDSGKVFAAGLDVYEKEPEIHEGLISSDKAVLLPHVGTATLETMVSPPCEHGTTKCYPKYLPRPRAADVGRYSARWSCWLSTISAVYLREGN